MAKTTQDFRDTVWQFYASHYRPMPWRDQPEPYYVLVSELMLQQTQVSRVIPKFEAFIAAFPNIASLAQASLADVLSLWSGLGYNRRARFLHETARKINDMGLFPDSYQLLIKLPGIGPNTAAAICNYAFLQPTPFVETNIRTVYFHEYFHDDPDLIDDKELLKLVEETLDKDNPREWFYALMDYGAYLKSQGSAYLDKSKHYKKQTPLKGSLRETRGSILKHLVNGSMQKRILQRKVDMDDRFLAALDGLMRDGLVEAEGQIVRLTGNGQAS